jgi:predicted metalloendopeptidase
MDSLFNIEYCNGGDKKLELLVRPNIPGLAENLYSSSEFIRHYKQYIKGAGKAFGIDDLEKTVLLEKGLFRAFEHVTDERVTSMKGQGFAKKFGKLPWNSFFAGVGLEGWKKMQISYKYPSMIRGLSTLLRQYPLSLWKMYISKIYLCNLARYTPGLDELYFDFYGKYLQGQKTKTPDTQLFLDFVYAIIPDTVSKIFWDACGDDEVVQGCRDIGNSIQKAAISRMRENPWLSAHSKIASIEKIKAIRYKIGRPDIWEPALDLELDPGNFMKNRFLLGEYCMRTLISRLGTRHTYWEEGIFRVNAYYFSEFNEIVFPYGILANPFYKKDASLAWNYGGIGCTFGHELCHAFDDDGKEYDQHGMVRKWWKREDIRAFAKRARNLESLYSAEKVLGRHLDGEITLSENIADIAGMAICLEALRNKLKGLPEEELLAHYREFFISYATSWRTLYRTKQLRTSLAADEHSPAYIRVNLVVAQMDEWYEAFGIDKSDPLYTKPEDRIRFF